MSRDTKRFIAYIVIVAVFVTAVGIGWHEVRKLDRLATTTQTGLIESCQVNGNSARRIKRAELMEEIVESHAIPAHYFPGIPPDLFHRLIREKNERRWARFKKSAPINCVKQYTDPPPQTH